MGRDDPEGHPPAVGGAEDGRPPEVLAVDPGPADSERIATELADAEGVSVTAIPDPEAVPDRLAEGEYACVLTAARFPDRDTDGVDVLERVRSVDPDLPVVMLAAADTADDDVGTRALRAGVTELLDRELVAGRGALLAERVRRAAERYREARAAERSREQYRRLVDRSPNPVVLCGVDGTIEYANPAAVEFGGVDAVADAIGESVLAFVHPEDRDAAAEHLRRVVETGEPIERREYRIVDRDGTTKHAIVTATPGTLGAGDGRVAQLVLNDITPYREATEAIEERERIIRELHEVAFDLRDCTEPEAVAERLVSAAEGILAFDTCVVNFERDGVLEIAATGGEVAPDEVTAMSVEEGIAGRTYRTGDSVLCRDVEEHPEANPQGPYRSAVSVPLDEHGVFQAAAREPGQFDATDLEHVELLCTHATQALDRIASTDRLRRERDRVRALFENTGDCIARITYEDGEPIVQAVNPAFEATFGYDAGAVVGESIDDVIVPPEYVSEATAINERAEGGERVEREVTRRTADGPREFRLRSIPVPDHDDETDVFAVYMDITERTRYRETLRGLSESALELLRAETTAEVCSVSVDIATDVLEQPFTEVFLWNDDADRLEPAARTEEAVATLENEPTFARDEGVVGHVYAAQEPRTFADVRTSELTDETTPEELRGYMAFPLGEHGVISFAAPEPDAFETTDVDLASILAANTEAALDRVTREELLRSREAELERQNERLEDFASIVSHDLRNPLNAAQGYVELAAERTDAAGDPLEKAAAALDRMEELVEDVLTLARHGQQVDALEPADLDALVSEAWRTVAVPAATLNRTGDLGTVVCDPSRTRELLENLLDNAIAHAGPDVTVRVGRLADGFFVADDGPGIPADDRDAVFEWGHSTATDGTGFGLAIVREIADAHGWTVRLTESDAGGARFEFRGVGEDRPDGAARNAAGE